jgi:hypothetical protein
VGPSAGLAKSFEALVSIPCGIDIARAWLVGGAPQGRAVPGEQTQTIVSRASVGPLRAAQVIFDALQLGPGMGQRRFGLRRRRADRGRHHERRLGLRAGHDFSETGRKAPERLDVALVLMGQGQFQHQALLLGRQQTRAIRILRQQSFEPPSEADDVPALPKQFCRRPSLGRTIGGWDERRAGAVQVIERMRSERLSPRRPRVGQPVPHFGSLEGMQRSVGIRLPDPKLGDPRPERSPLIGRQLLIDEASEEIRRLIDQVEAGELIRKMPGDLLSDGTLGDESRKIEVQCVGRT